jgi:hypothetical protein
VDYYIGIIIFNNMGFLHGRQVESTAMDFGFIGETIHSWSFGRCKSSSCWGSLKLSVRKDFLGWLEEMLELVEDIAREVEIHFWYKFLIEGSWALNFLIKSLVGGTVCPPNLLHKCVIAC